VIKRLFQSAFILLILSSLYLSLSPVVSSVPLMWNDKAIHFISYFVLILTLDFSWCPGKQLVTKSILALVYSGLIEYGQSYVPGREMSLGDLIANACGIVLFLLMVPLFRRMSVYKVLKLS